MKAVKYLLGICLIASSVSAFAYHDHHRYHHRYHNYYHAYYPFYAGYNYGPYYYYGLRNGMLYNRYWSTGWRPVGYYCQRNCVINRNGYVVRCYRGC